MYAHAYIHTACFIYEDVGSYSPGIMSTCCEEASSRPLVLKLISIVASSQSQKGAATRHVVGEQPYDEGPALAQLP